MQSNPNTLSTIKPLCRNSIHHVRNLISTTSGPSTVVSLLLLPIPPTLLLSLLVFDIHVICITSPADLNNAGIEFIKIDNQFLIRE